MQILKFITIIAVLSLTQADFLPVVSVETEQATVGIDYQSAIKNFTTGLFNHFGLNTTNISSCFNTASATAYFQLLTAAYEGAAAIIDSLHAQTPQYIAEVIAYNTTLKSTFACVQKSQDFANLMQVLGVNSTNTSLIAQLFFESHTYDFFNAFTPVYFLIQQGQFTNAGDVFGNFIKLDLLTIQDEGFDFQNMRAFSNGHFYYFNLSLPTELFYCYNSTTAQMAMDLVIEWAAVVANSTLQNCVNNTIKYFETNQTKYIMQTLPQGVFPCEDATYDQQRFNNAVGTDIHGPAFQQAMDAFVVHNTTVYYAYFTAMNQFFNKMDPFDAGVYYGAFLQGVASTIVVTDDI